MAGPGAKGGVGLFLEMALGERSDIDSVGQLLLGSKIIQRRSNPLKQSLTLPRQIHILPPSQHKETKKFRYISQPIDAISPS